MTDYQKLVDVFIDELPEDSPWNGNIKGLVEKLIAHGVTFATDNNVGDKWIPVTKRLPEYEEPVMGWDAEMRDMGIVNFVYGQFFDILDMSETNVTHWMPLPEPPKGE